MHAGTSHSKGSHGTSLLCPSKASRTRRAPKLDQCAPIIALSTKLQCKRHVLDNVGSRVSDLPGWKAETNGSGVQSRSMVMRSHAWLGWRSTQRFARWVSQDWRWRRRRRRSGLGWTSLQPPAPDVRPWFRKDCHFRTHVVIDRGISTRTYDEFISPSLTLCMLLHLLILHIYTQL